MKKCKCCYNHRRSWSRYQEVQQCEEEVQAVSDDAATQKFCFKAFCKNREQSKKDHKRQVFNLGKFIESWRSTRGLRSEHQGEMMWEGEYFEFAQTAKAGFLTKPEREASWAAWLKDVKVPKDEAGPRGYRRVWVRTKDLVSTYEDGSQSTAFERLQDLKKLTDAQASAKINMVFDGDGSTSADLCDFGDMRSKLKVAMAGDGKNNAFDGTALMP